jgi:hypothetical protein
MDNIQAQWAFKENIFLNIRVVIPKEIIFSWVISLSRVRLHRNSCFVVYLSPLHSCAILTVYPDLSSV